MAESILVTGKKISSMELVTNVTGIEKIPTGQPDDLAITPNQIADHTIARGDLASHGDLSQVEVDLTTQIATLAGDVASADNSIRGLIAAEEAARIAGDDSLQAAIDAESLARTDADVGLQAALDAEVAARIAADDLKVDKEGSVSSVAGRVGDVELVPSDVLVDGFGSQEDVNKYVPKPFLSGYAYGLGERVVLDNGDIVKSAVAGNIVDPNSDMTGWIRTNDASQIFDASGKNQQQINDEKADKYGYRWTEGTAGQESAINTIMGYADNAIAAGIRGAHVQQGSRNNENIIGGDASTVGVDVPNVVDTSKTYNAHYALVGGYDNVNNVLAGIVVGYHCKALDDGTGSAGATHATIVGGSYHTFVDGDYSACLGGTNNTLDYKSGGAYSFFGAGSTNSMFAKFSTIMSSWTSRIGSSGSEKEYSGVYHSNISTVDGNYATVLGGNECKATKDYSFARGKGAVANNVGETAFSTGKFKTSGDSGQSTLHLMRQTTDAIQTQLLCSDGTSGNTITAIGQNTSLVVKGLVSAYNVTTNSTASFEIVSHISRIGLDYVVVNALTVTPIFNPENLPLPSVVASTSIIQVRVTGLASNTINWTCKLDQVWSRSL